MEDLNVAHAKIGVGAGLVAATGFTLNEWVAIITILYFALQIGLLVPKYRDAFTNWRERRRTKKGSRR